MLQNPGPPSKILETLRGLAVTNKGQDHHDVKTHELREYKEPGMRVPTACSVSDLMEETY